MNKTITDREIMKAFRAKLQLSQSEAARLLGFSSRQTIWAFETDLPAHARPLTKTVKYLIHYILKDKANV